MSGSHKPTTERQRIIQAMQTPPAAGHYTWDGADEADRPLSRDEMVKGMVALQRKRGRPTGSGQKEQVAIRFDHEVLAAFRRDGPGWQTRMNEALKDWLKSHPAGSA